MIKSEIVGLDLDNTLISFEKSIHSLAVSKGLIHPDSPRKKKWIRDTVRDLPDGEASWQILQALAYGTHIHDAELIDGVRDFIRNCRLQGIPVRIISHKTEFATRDETQTNLRKAALEWLRQNHFFSPLTSPGGMGLSETDVFFESTREEKIQRIKELGCTIFVDDLEEIFLEASFPLNVDRILFSSEPGSAGDFKCCSSWPEITNIFFSKSQPLSVKLSEIFGDSITHIEEIKGGLNSKVFKVITKSKGIFAVKAYFKNPADERDRLETEFSSLQFLWDQGIRSIPQPLKRDRNGNLGIYEFIEGKKLSGSEVTTLDIQAFTEFMKKLESLKSKPESQKISRASEACFSLQELRENIESRLGRFKSLSPLSPVLEFLNTQLRPNFLSMIQEAESSGASQGELQLSERTLSPSDFGFHNSLRKDDGSICFVDFEYFGWDDPAKLISDFILHPGMDLQEEHQKIFVSQILEIYGPLKAEKLLKRLNAVYPLYGIKWCLIILNEFLPDNIMRRKFADPQFNLEKAQEVQLTKATYLLRKIKTPGDFGKDFFRA